MKTLQLASALRGTISGMTRRLKKTVHTIDNFSLSEFASLSYLYRAEALSTSELAALIVIKVQSMSEILIKLEGLGIIQRAPSPTDGRKTLISLTAKGRELVEQTRYERDEWLAGAIDHTLKDEEKHILQQAVAILDKLIEHK